MRANFNNNQAQQEMEEGNISDSELDNHVRDALSSVSKGDSDNYNQLVGLMHYTKGLGPDEVALLQTSLKALARAASYVDIVLHNSLLSAVFTMSMWNHVPDVMDALLDVVISLATSNGKYVELCLDMLVSNFTPPRSFLDVLKQPRVLTKKDQVLSRVHTALKSITKSIPLAPLRLELIVISKISMTFKMDPSIVEMYVENMLRLESGYLGEFVGRSMLAALVIKLVDLDVEIAWDDIIHDDFSKGIFEMELEDMVECTDDFEEDGSELSRGLRGKSLEERKTAEKLDSLMVLTFEHLETCGVERLRQIFETLLSSFKRSVMTAYKSKFAQFVIFYACALDPEVCGARFAEELVAEFVRTDNPPFVRMSAVAYLASYLSRGRFLEASFATSWLSCLVNWCLEYCNTHDNLINPIAHQVFYSACQAIMYVLCFRMRSIMSVPRLKSELLHMPIGSILTHRLSPLKVCLPSVVEEFLRQADAANLFTSSESLIFNDLLESDLSKAFGGNERLDMFFPFDPCLLRKCDRYIRPNFTYWSTVKRTCDDEEGLSSDEEVAEVFPENLNELDDMMGRSYDEKDGDLNDFDPSLNQMSITPKNSFIYKFGAGLQKATRMPSIIRPSMSPESL